MDKDSIGSVINLHHEEVLLTIVMGKSNRSYTISDEYILRKIVALIDELERAPCPDCPHREHKEPCAVFVTDLDTDCGCGYGVSEEGSDLPEGGYDAWNPTDFNILQ